MTGSLNLDCECPYSAGGPVAARASGHDSDPGARQLARAGLPGRLGPPARGRGPGMARASFPGRPVAAVPGLRAGPGGSDRRGSGPSG